jgi:hypothetical protein
MPKRASNERLVAENHAMVGSQIRGIDAQIPNGDAFHNDGPADLKADYVLANTVGHASR